MKSKKEKEKAACLAVFIDSVFEAIEDIEYSGIFDFVESEEKGNAWDKAWGKAFNYKEIETALKRNFLRAFEAAWKAAEKTKG